MAITKRSWESWWDRKAPEFFLRHRPRRKVFRRIAEIISESGETVLDVGCCNCLAYLLMEEKKLDYTGVDFTLKFIERARELYPGINVHHASALDLPFDSSEFDVTFCQSLLEHIHPDDVHLAINEMMRVAKNKAIFSFFRPPRENALRNAIKNRDYISVRYTKKYITDIIEKHPKFKSLEIETFLRWALYKVDLTP